jgi:hypothetical protein
MHLSSLLDGELHVLCVCPGTACVCQDFPEVVQQRSFGAPELSLKALMAYPDVKLVAFFVHRCSREAVPPQLGLGMTSQTLTGYVLYAVRMSMAEARLHDCKHMPVL